MGFRGLTINTPATDEAHILAEDDAAIYQSVFGGDCVFDIGSRMNATVLSNNKVRVADGVVCAGGHVGRNNYGDYEDLVIENGTSGMNRNDFIVAKFTSTGPGGVDTFSLEVKKGTAGITASDPVVTKGNLYEGASLREFPLYRVKIEGLSITAVEQLFTVRKTNEQLQNEVIELNGKYKNYTLLGSGSSTAQTVNIDISGYDYLYCYLNYEPVHNINPTLVYKDLLQDGQNQLIRMQWSPEVGVVYGTALVSGNYITKIYSNKESAHMFVYGVR